MIKLMEAPKDSENYPYFHLSDCYCKAMTGKEVRYRFINQGIWHENHIPQCLKKQNWEPDDEKQYLVWWHHTDPSDPSDSGENILDYIEMYDDKKQTVSDKPSKSINKIDTAIDILKAFKNNDTIEYRESDTDEWRIADIYDVLRYLSNNDKYQARVRNS